MFNVAELEGCNFNGSNDKEIVVNALHFAGNEIDSAALVIRNIISGVSPITVNTRRDLLAARASLLFFEANLNHLKTFTEGKPEISKYYFNALSGNKINFNNIQSATEFLKKYFPIYWTRCSIESHGIQWLYKHTVMPCNFCVHLLSHAGCWPAMDACVQGSRHQLRICPLNNLIWQRGWYPTLWARISCE